MPDGQLETRQASPASKLPDIDYLLEENFEGSPPDGWETGSDIRLVTEDAHNGAQALRLDSASTQRLFPTQPGLAYKLTAWVRISAEEGQDWGGFRLEAQDEQWNSLAHSGWILAQTHGSQWRKFALNFTAAGPETRLLIGYFGGPGRNLTALLDDVRVFQKGDNRPPVVQATLSATRVEDLPADLGYELSGDDPDGAITRIVWDFGDGTRAFSASGTRLVGVGGTFNGTLRVEDDEGALTQQNFTWQAVNPDQPALTLEQPPDETDQALLTLRGMAGSSVTRVQISSDRGAWVDAAGRQTWSAQIPLSPGWNRLLIQAQDQQGRYATTEALVRRVLPGPLQVSDLPLSAGPVERWQPVEIRFKIDNSTATQVDFPYNTHPPTGLEQIDGISVDGLFTPDNWQTIYRRPAFYRQPYEFEDRDGQEWAVPSGEAAWVVRFAPPVPGSWKYRIEVSEASGQAVSDEGTLQVEPAGANRPGPVRASPADPRYFEYADGTPFLGAGYNLSFSPEGYSNEALAKMAEIPPDSATLFRWWLGGSVWGSAWQPWNSLTVGYEGYLPYTGLSLDSAYGDGLAALKLDADNPVMFQGWNSGRASLEPGQRYRLSVRWRSAGITGPVETGQPYGLSIKFADWPQPGTTDTLPALIPHVSGNTPWIFASAEFTADGDRLPGLALVLENTTDGAGYVDEIILTPLSVEGQAGAQVLRGGRMNSHLAFDPIRAAGIDRILENASERGLFFRLVIGEKDEWLVNHLSPSGLPDPLGGNYFNGQGTAGGSLHSAYWRYLSARYAAYPAVHSWELVNESAPAPGGPFELAAALARYMDADGNPHPASLSTWATLAEDAWLSPAGETLAPVDFHGYANPSDHPEWASDSAAYFLDNAIPAAAAGFQRPVVWGELGLLEGPGSSSEDPRLALDTAGRWLHDILWARTGPAGVYPIFWFADTIFENNLHHEFGAWNRFMEGLPLNNGHYEDAGVDLPGSELRVVGQKDLTAGQAHLWIDNLDDTWQSALDGRSVSPASGEFAIQLDHPGARFHLTWVDTNSGQPVQTQTLTADTAGLLRIGITDLQKDIGLLIKLE